MISLLRIRLHHDRIIIERVYGRRIDKAYDTLYKEIVGLPDDKLNMLIDFARFLKQSVANSDGSVTKTRTSDDASVQGAREIGFMSDDFIYIAPDFDECLEGLEDYV